MLQAELSEIDHDIDEAIRQSPVWQAEAELLDSVTGIGKATTLVLKTTHQPVTTETAVQDEGETFEPGSKLPG